MARNTSRTRRGDIDSIYNALRPRLEHLGAVNISTGGGVGAHTHTAAEISFQPVGFIAEDNCQVSQEELDDEKLARSGEQEMLGDLPMAHHSINDIHDADIEGTATIGEDANFTGGAGSAKISNPRELSFKADAVGEADINNVRDVSFVGAVGEGVINAPRVVHMTGDHLDDEAKVDGLERVVFNNEPTASSIELPSRIEYNVGVTAGTDYTAAEGESSWDDLEDTLVVYVASGAALFVIAVGWSVKLAVNGFYIG